MGSTHRWMFVASALGLKGCDSFTPLEGTYWVTDLWLIEECPEGPDTGFGYGPTYLSEADDFSIEEVLGSSFTFSHTTWYSGGGWDLEMSCGMDSEDRYTFTCGPDVNWFGNSYTLTGVWLAEDRLHGDLNYMRCPSGECSNNCVGDWVFHAGVTPPW